MFPRSGLVDGIAVVSAVRGHGRDAAFCLPQQAWRLSRIVSVLVAGHAPAGITGRYLDGRREARANSQAYDREARRRLRSISLDLAGSDR